MFRKVFLLGAAALAVAAAGCGDDDDSDAGAAMATDGAFVAQMTSHHEAAIEMAEIARERADHAEVRDLADQVIAAQSDEIEAMDGMHERMFGEAMGAMDHGTLGMDMDAMGMDMDMMALEEARPFDSVFIDGMIAHHQGAIRMARVELERGEDEEVKGLAEDIVEAQSHEIEEMSSRRKEWYGAPSPAGGMPHMDEAMPSDEGMGH